MGSAGTEKEPSSLVEAVTSRLVSRLRIFTSTLLRTAPVLSVTVPLIAPRVCWPRAGNESRSRLLRNTTSERTHLCIFSVPAIYPRQKCTELRRGISQGRRVNRDESCEKSKEKSLI